LLETVGIVYSVMDQAFDVLLVKYGIIKRIPNKNKEVSVQPLSIVRVNLVPVPNSTKFNVSTGRWLIACCSSLLLTLSGCLRSQR